MKRIFYILAIMLPCAVFAQNPLPEWAKESFRMELKNSYIETIVVTTEVTTDAMRQKAKEMLAERRRLATGERVIFSEGETQSQRGLTIAAQQLLEYIDYEKEVGYFLFQTLKNPTAQYEKVEYTNRYPFSARVFVPGMAQLHKGSAAKGIAFIAGEAAMVGGIVAFESMRTSYLSKIDATPSPSLQKQYAADADNMKNLRNGFIAGAAAVYVWNVIDGIAAKGKKHILVGENSLRIAPYATPYENGISLSLNF